MILVPQNFIKEDRSASEAVGHQTDVRRRFRNNWTVKRPSTPDWLLGENAAFMSLPFELPICGSRVCFRAGQA